MILFSVTLNSFIDIIILCRVWFIILYYYIDTDEIPGFFLSLKNHVFILRAVKILFLSFTCEDIGVAMVTNINFDFLEQKI